MVTASLAEGIIVYRMLQAQEPCNFEGIHRMQVALCARLYTLALE